MVYYESNELYHHGILGQKWGVRRFQNSDGSLTNAGKSRYRRGAEVYREHTKFQRNEEERLKKNSKAYQKAQKEADRLLKKYGLDADDGGGGDRERWDDKTLERAGTRYWEKVEDMAALDDEFYDKALKHANSKILEKYGDVGISDMKHYQAVNAGVAFVSFLAVTGAISILASK